MWFVSISEKKNRLHFAHVLYAHSIGSSAKMWKGREFARHLEKWQRQRERKKGIKNQNVEHSKNAVVAC